MPIDLEKAQMMFKLTRKNNWNACYDRLEHFKRFSNLDLIVKELVKSGWIILHKKPNYQAVSLNTQYKKDIIDFIELKMPHLRGMIK